MKKVLKYSALYLLTGAIMMIGMKGVDTAWPFQSSLTVIHYVCVSKDGSLKGCKALTDSEIKKLKE